MELINDSDAQEIRERLEGMSGPVTLIHFTQQSNLEYGVETRQLLEELTEISSKLSLKTYDFLSDTEEVAQYAVDKVPATVIRSGRDYGIRFFGLPAGYEFAALIDGILAVSKGDSGLLPESRHRLAELSQPLHLEVFTTPTCPYCPPAVCLAYQFALESEWVRADGIEATEFPDLAEKFRVMSVPQTIINGKAHVEGTLPEDFFLDAILKTLKAPKVN